MPLERLLYMVTSEARFVPHTYTAHTYSDVGARCYEKALYAVTSTNAKMWRRLDYMDRVALLIHKNRYLRNMPDWMV